MKVPVGADVALRRLAERFDIVWASAWSHNAHPALRQVLDLPESPWPFLPIQFHKLDFVRAFAAGRPWAWIDDSIHDLGRLDDPPDGILVPVDSGSGIMSADPLWLQRGIDHLTACLPSPNQDLRVPVSG